LAALDLERAVARAREHELAAGLEVIQRVVERADVRVAVAVAAPASRVWHLLLAELVELDRRDDDLALVTPGAERDHGIVDLRDLDCVAESTGPFEAAWLDAEAALAELLVARPAPGVDPPEARLDADRQHAGIGAELPQLVGERIDRELAGRAVLVDRPQDWD